MIFHVGAIVRDKPRKGKDALCGRGDEVPCEPRLAGPGGPRISAAFGTDENR